MGSRWRVGVGVGEGAVVRYGPVLAVVAGPAEPPRTLLALLEELGGRADLDTKAFSCELITAFATDDLPPAGAVALLGDRLPVVLHGDVTCRVARADGEVVLRGRDAAVALNVVLDGPVARVSLHPEARGEDGEVPGTDLVAGAVPGSLAVGVRVSGAPPAIRPPGRVRAVILDHGGVLTRPSEAVLATFPARFGMTLSEFRQAVGQVGARLRLDPMAEIETGRMSEAEFRREVEAELPAGAHLEGFGEAYYEHLQPNPPMIDLAKALREAGYRTAVATNAAPEWRPLWRRQIPDIEAIFDVVVDSGEVGARKPDPAVYRLLLERLGVAADACVFVDDKDENCAAAREAGMHAILFTGNEQAVADLTGVLGGGDMST